MNNENNRVESSLELIREYSGQIDLIFKIILLGDSSVGKSCICIRATSDTFDPFYSTTVGFDFNTVNIKLNNNTLVKLQIWDTCGQEIYRSLIINFYRNCSLAIIVYAIDEYLF